MNRTVQLKDLYTRQAKIYNVPFDGQEMKGQFVANIFDSALLKGNRKNKLNINLNKKMLFARKLKIRKSAVFQGYGIQT